MAEFKWISFCYLDHSKDWVLVWCISFVHFGGWIHSVSDGLFVEVFWGGWEGGLDLELGYYSTFLELCQILKSHIKNASVFRLTVNWALTVRYQ